MSKTDELIERALSAEDRELLARHTEPGYFSQAFGLFRGSLGWVVWLAYLTSIAAFAGFIWALWQAWTTPETLLAVRWGVVAIVLFQYTAMVKSFLGTHMEANRTLRELKRIELQVAMLREKDNM
ncbi:DUF6768 family protein [Marilutibacter alkalisoli]|uniref:Uncharacterized protein n=1 Tax=Marilutibacter alkalisoli TaxID=2591633 RepID=A0A514BN27_9GAMM|nr:DUF6768 family protein [Lysobacter alkalisoli]QDH68786.1 hypothetical protein FKV23_00650 [Lysobacter alkalisoli]